MNLDNILKRRALRLKSELAEGASSKSSIFSVIYPATDHGGIPQVVKTPSSIPSSNDADRTEPAEKDKGEKELDEPGPSKTTSSSLPVAPGQSALVPDTHKKAAFDLGYFGENRSERFIDRCVELITGVKKLEQVDPAELEPGGACGCETTPCSCKGENEGDNGHKGISDVIKKLQKPKTSYG